nr:uncharacterized protein LOC123761373 isoform X2 [Procambarus clarkii]
MKLPAGRCEGGGVVVVTALIVVTAAGAAAGAAASAAAAGDTNYASTHIYLQWLKQHRQPSHNTFGNDDGSRDEYYGDTDDDYDPSNYGYGPDISEQDHNDFESLFRDLQTAEEKKKTKRGGTCELRNTTIEVDKRGAEHINPCTVTTSVCSGSCPSDQCVATRFTTRTITVTAVYEDWEEMEFRTVPVHEACSCGCTTPCNDVDCHVVGTDHTALQRKIEKCTKNKKDKIWNHNTCLCARGSGKCNKPARVGSGGRL